MVVNKFLQEYIKNKKSYEKLVVVLRSLLEEITINNGLNPQTFQARAKDEESLEKHLVGNKYKDEKISSIHEIPDLAACRVIFYSRDDFEKFKQIIQKEFKIIKIKDKMLDDGYKGFHFIATLGKKRKNLTEYKSLSGLTFEMQVTLIFAHGWNEWEHDIFYKDKKEVKKYFPKQFEALNTMAMKISEQLWDVQNAWEDIRKQYEQASQGKEVFSLYGIKKLAESDDNNEIYNRLNNLQNLIDETGEFPVSLNFEEFVSCLGKIIEKAQANKIINEKTVFGIIPGKKLEDIVETILKLSNQLAHKGIDVVTNILLSAYPKLPRNIQNKVEEWFKEFSKYKYYTLKNQGYIIQGYFLDLITNWDSKNRKIFFPIICSLGDSLLSPDFGGSEWTDYKTISFHRNALGDDKYLKKIRNDYIDLLINMYSETDFVEQKLVILRTLNKAMQTSFYGGKIRTVIKENVEKIVSFYKSILPKADLKEVSEMEDFVTWAEKRFSGEKIKEIKEFWDSMREINEYSIYRVLVGYDRSFRLRENIGYEECEKIREREIDDFVNQISDTNISEWESRIILLTKECEESEDKSKYYNFGNLLKKIGERQGKLALKLLTGGKLKFFQENILAGLLLNKESEVVLKTREIIAEKIEKNELLYEIARAFWINDVNELQMIGKIIKKTEKIRKKSDKIKIYWQLLLNLKFKKEHKNLILKVIQNCNKIGYHLWTSLYYRHKKDGPDIFSILSNKEWDIIFETLVHTKRIDYHEEQILSNIIERNPKLFVEIFRKRIIKGSKNKIRRDYEDIPYKMHTLTDEGKELLAKNNKEIVGNVLGWFNYSYGWQAGIFLKSVYPNSDDYLEKRILEIIDTGDKEKWKKYALPFIKWHESSNVESFVKRTIEKLEKDKDIWNACMVYLLNPGMTSGNIDDSIIGDALRKKLEMINSWKTSNKQLIEFQEECKKHLNKRIKEEDDEHKQRLASMKRKHPSKSKK